MVLILLNFFAYDWNSYLVESSKAYYFDAENPDIFE
jgi:hypothetical protein